MSRACAAEAREGTYVRRRCRRGRTPSAVHVFPTWRARERAGIRSSLSCRCAALTLPHREPATGSAGATERARAPGRPRIVPVPRRGGADNHFREGTPCQGESFARWR
jgi:hypothetical protein